MSESSTGWVPALLLTAAQAAQFLNVVHTVYSAILRECQHKGKGSRFRKVGRGQFALATTKEK